MQHGYQADPSKLLYGSKHGTRGWLPTSTAPRRYGLRRTPQWGSSGGSCQYHGRGGVSAYGAALAATLGLRLAPYQVTGTKVCDVVRNPCTRFWRSSVHVVETMEKRA